MPLSTANGIDKIGDLRSAHAESAINIPTGKEGEIDAGRFESNESHADVNVTDENFDHIVESRNSIYRVQLNKYAARDDHTKPSENIFDHFTRRYCQSQNRRRRSSF